MGMSFIEPVSVSLRLPQKSYVYPDTFAIYWQFDKRYSDDEKENVVIQIKLRSVFGDGLSETFDADDSLVLIPYEADYIYEESLIIEPRVTKSIITARDYPPGHERLLRIISKNDKIEALIGLVRANPRLTNLLMLAESYEQEKCFVNAFYIYKRMLHLYPNEGVTQWKQFYNRHSTEFKLLNDIRR